MLSLPNNCRCSEIRVSPSNWNRSAASVAKNWRVHYRFYDPAEPKPIQVIIKSRINRIKNLDARRHLVKELIENEYKKLKYEGYHPVRKADVTPPVFEYEISPDAPFIEALRKSLTKLSLTDETRVDVHYVINGLEKASRQLKLDTFPVSQISRKHIKAILEHCEKVNKKWSAHRYNIYRAYLLMLYKELVEMETVPANPVRDISKKKTLKKIRAVLSVEQQQVINEYIKVKDYRFWLFIHLFYHSGGRIRELTQLRASDVNLDEQTYTTVIRKGRAHREAKRTIKSLALPFWKEFLFDCKPQEYLFGIDFLPSDRPMVPDTITRRWQKLVKKELKIDRDFYSLKHLNTAAIVDQFGDKAAAAQNGHLSTLMVNTVYDIRKSERQHEQLKDATNSFAS